MSAEVHRLASTLRTDDDADVDTRLCEAFCGWDYSSIPASVITTIKSFIMDTLGVIGAGAQAQGVAELRRRAALWESRGSATALGGNRRHSPPTAAMINAAAAHALDFDDQHDPARVHAYCVVLPVVLAVSEDRGAVSGCDFLAAIATGVELHARLGLTCYNSTGKGWHATTTLGVIACQPLPVLLLSLIHI